MPLTSGALDLQIDVAERLHRPVARLETQRQVGNVDDVMQRLDRRFGVGRLRQRQRATPWAMNVSL
jgi:hypothetical protein